MAFDIVGFSWSLPANIDMSNEATYQFTPVIAVTATGAGINTGTACAPVATTGDQIIGVTQNNPQVGEAAQLVSTGISKVLVNYPAQINDKLMALPAGGFAQATTGKYAVAIALQVATGGVEYIAALLTNLGKQ